MLDLTKQERSIILTLLVFFVIGSAVSIYKKYLIKSVLTESQLEEQQRFLTGFQETAKLMREDNLSDSEKLVSANLVTPGSVSQKEKGKKALPDTKININEAGLEELTRLPHVGPVMARRIIEWRQTVGRFQKPEDLTQVKGIGRKTFEKLSPFITVN